MLGLLLGAETKKKLIKEHGIVPKSRLLAKPVNEIKAIDLKTLALT